KNLQAPRQIRFKSLEEVIKLRKIITAYIKEAGSCSACPEFISGSVQVFAVWLASVPGSLQTTLPLANASGPYPRT
ncbi:MAG: hypothetical protein AVDCRST_MAG96-3783, partial [uncultured Segetibacter sp.]